MNVELVSWDRFHQLARVLALSIRDSGFRPDMVVAIARGGVMPARVLCDYLSIMEMTCIRVEHYRARTKAPEAHIKYPLNASVDDLRILVVDDVSDTGESFVAALEHIRQRGEPAEIRTCALQHKTVSSFVPDYYAHEINEWRWVTYPWAVIEDLGELIKEAGVVGQDFEQIVRSLLDRYGIKPTHEQIADALEALHLVSSR